MIPLIEPKYDKATAKALSKYIDGKGWGTEYKETRKFEEQVAKFLSVKYCFAVPNGTIALSIALLASGLDGARTVMVPSVTMIATANAARLLGVGIDFCDIDEQGCMDVDTAIHGAKFHNQAVFYVALNGRCGNIEKLYRRLKRRDIALIEDACQAFGSYHNSKPIGTFGELGVYSLSPHKIITTGQGGLIVTNKKAIADKVRYLKDFGRDKGGTDWHPHFGINAKFTDFQAIIGQHQMKTIKQRIAKKREIYRTYEKRLRNVDGVEMIPTDLNQTTPWLVDIYVDYHVDLQKYLKKQGIETRLMYPEVYSQPCYGKDIFYHNTYSFVRRGLWLPSAITITKSQINKVCKEIEEYMS